MFKSVTENTNLNIETCAPELCLSACTEEQLQQKHIYSMKAHQWLHATFNNCWRTWRPFWFSWADMAIVGRLYGNKMGMSTKANGRENKLSTPSLNPWSTVPEHKPLQRAFTVTRSKREKKKTKKEKFFFLYSYSHRIIHLSFFLLNKLNSKFK